MDRATLLTHLAEAERQIAQGRSFIASQQRALQELRVVGEETAKAEAMLEGFLASQMLHEQEHDRILSQLEN